MKKKAINILTVFVCLAAFSAAAVAYPKYRLEITIPFDFVLKSQTIPAGKYSFERMSPDDSTLLVLRSADRKINVIFRVQSFPLRKTVEKTQLVFKRDEEKYLLTEIREANDRFTLRILLNDSER